MQGDAASAPVQPFVARNQSYQTVSGCGMDRGERHRAHPALREKRFDEVDPCRHAVLSPDHLPD